MPYKRPAGTRKDGTSVPSSDAELGTRLAELRRRLGSKKRAGEVAGVTAEQWTKWESGAVRWGFQGVARACAATGVSLDWLATGQGSPEVGQRELAVVEGDYGSERRLGDYVLVPRYDVTAAAGSGSVIHSEQIVDYLAFKADWVRDELGVSPRNLLLIKAVGDSMKNTIDHGDLLLVSTGDTRVTDNAIYAISVDGDLMVKRIQKKLDGTLVVISDNPAYAAEEVHPAQADTLRVVGQVVWAGGRI